MKRSAGHGISSEELRRIDPINPGFIDALEEANRRENDAGRDAVIEAVARSFGRNDGDTEFALEKLHHEGYEVRALASAPSETVGREENVVDVYAALKCVRGCATDEQFQELRADVERIMDDVEHAAFLRGRKAGKDYGNMWRDQHEADKALALSTADRDAIREALEEAIAFVEDEREVRGDEDDQYEKPATPLIEKLAALAKRLEVTS